MVDYELTASSTNITVGDTVTFTIKNNMSSSSRNDFGITVNGVSIISGDFIVWGGYSKTKDYTFNSAGEFLIHLVYIDGTHTTTPDFTITVSDTPIVHNYAIEFDESSYSTCNGSCTVSATLTDDNVAVSGETVTLTGLSSSVTATTDSNGVATFNLTGISEDKTLTVTYDEVSDTASLTYGLATLNGSLTCLGKRMASNLTSKGITGVDYSDGLTSLADEILNIPTLDDYEEVELLITYTDTSTETITVLKEKTTP